MAHSILITVHVFAATVGLLSGFLSMAFRKGSGLHRAAGNIFFVSMLIMSAAGAYIASFIRPNGGNIMGGTLTFYLVATAWVAAKRRERAVGIFDWSALLGALAIAGAGATWGFQAANSPTGSKFGYPPALYFIFGSIALLFAASDVRTLVARGIVGAQRIARHLWRMCLALLIATLSFYPGQAQLFSRAIRETNLLYVPHLLLAGSMIFWMVRVLVRKRTKRDKVIDADYGNSDSPDLELA